VCIFLIFLLHDLYKLVLKTFDYDSDKYEIITIESKIREGVFHKVVKDLETGKAISCSCKCWSKGNKQCAAMRTIG
jgi:hypothetical protein